MSDTTVTVKEAIGRVDVRPTETAVNLTVGRPREAVVTFVGVQGPQGVAAAETLREATIAQATPASVWTLDHNLGFRPNVSVTDTAGDDCEGDVDHPTLNQTVVTFSAAFAGTARLS